jgi:hypothetical protein
MAVSTPGVPDREEQTDIRGRHAERRERDQVIGSYGLAGVIGGHSMAGYCASRPSGTTAIHRVREMYRQLSFIGKSHDEPPAL